MRVCGNLREEEGVEIQNVNAQHFEKEDVFLTHKPEYVLTGDFQKYDMLTITMENISVFWSEHDFKYEIDNYIMGKENEINHKAWAIEELQGKLEEAETELATIKNSKAWRFISGYRRMKNRIFRK